MDRIKLTNNFSLDEFVPKLIIDKFGSKGQWYIDRRIVVLAQAIRDHFGKSMTINNWFTDGPRKESGLRLQGTKTGAEFSQHKYGRAIDFIIEGLTDDEVAADIIKNESKFIALGLTTLENANVTTGWTHADIRYTGLNKLLIVNP